MISAIKQKIKQWLRLVTQSKNKSPENKAIIIAGMRHSGSTALFNIIRITAKLANIETNAFYSEKYPCIKQTGIALTLIKTHEFRDDVAELADFIITTRRDIRDTVASGVRRKFYLVTKLGNPVEYAKYNRMLHDVWNPISDFEFVYEDFISNPIQTIKKIQEKIGITNIPAEKVLFEINSLPTDQYDITLLSPTHITDPEHILTYKDTLDHSTIEKINSDHFKWLKKYQYDTAVTN